MKNRLRLASVRLLIFRLVGKIACAEVSRGPRSRYGGTPDLRNQAARKRQSKTHRMPARLRWNYGTLSILYFQSGILRPGVQGA